MLVNHKVEQIYGFHRIVIVLQIFVRWRDLIPPGLARGPYLRRPPIIQTKTVVGDLLDLDARVNRIIDYGWQWSELVT
jgi:hypothetical protein